MTTAQLIVLWYAALLIVTLLLLGAIDLLPAVLIAHISAAVVVFAAVLIYSLKPHPLARRRYVVLGVLLPPLAIGGGGFSWTLYQQHRDQQEAQRAATRVREAMDISLKAEIREAVKTKQREGAQVMVKLPSVGIVRFPATMSDDDIARALEAHVFNERESAQGR
jgi:hypothetical protein